MKPRHLGYGAGTALVLLGLFGLVTNATETHPVGWALWFGGAAVAHDLLLAPLILAVAVATTRLPARYRVPLQTVLVTVGCMALIAIPLLFLSRIRH
jgi:hypothetical protein